MRRLARRRGGRARCRPRTARRWRARARRRADRPRGARRRAGRRRPTASASARDVAPRAHPERGEHDHRQELDRRDRGQRQPVDRRVEAAVHDRQHEAPGDHVAIAQQVPGPPPGGEDQRGRGDPQPRHPEHVDAREQQHGERRAEVVEDGADDEGQACTHDQQDRRREPHREGPIDGILGGMPSDNGALDDDQPSIARRAPSRRPRQPGRARPPRRPLRARRRRAPAPPRARRHDHRLPRRRRPARARLHARRGPAHAPRAAPDPRRSPRSRRARPRSSNATASPARTAST